MAAPPTPGRFITLEGGEGAGKSTQARLLAQALRDAGQAVAETREPGGAPGAEALRELLLHGPTAFVPEAETLLHFAARAEHLARTIRPALAAGRWVVCDRFADSTMAYQGYGLGVDRAMIATLTALLETKPDLTLVLDVSAATASARLAGRGRAADRYEALDPAFHERVRQGFRDIAAAAPERCVTIDADPAPHAVHAAVLAAVRARFGNVAK
ncbi:MAG TPA: dTMP kinase [Acetobacteraceae bacterium]|nr:dTMP kinase [Acetobacteraceae bacterium]